MESAMIMVPTKMDADIGRPVAAEIRRARHAL